MLQGSPERTQIGNSDERAGGSVVEYTRARTVGNRISGGQKNTGCLGLSLLLALLSLCRAEDNLVDRFHELNVRVEWEERGKVWDLRQTRGRREEERRGRGTREEPEGVRKTIPRGAEERLWFRRGEGFRSEV